MYSGLGFFLTSNEPFSGWLDAAISSRILMTLLVLFSVMRRHMHVWLNCYFAFQEWTKAQTSSSRKNLKPVKGSALHDPWILYTFNRWCASLNESTPRWECICSVSETGLWCENQNGDGSKNRPFFSSCGGHRVQHSTCRSHPPPLHHHLQGL